ncbi:FixH family protein [Pseudemcibacter aquimaris]|uniref:FixH family protein n=1 Tax=Pseudemcibacter aquimaris TaxID=2857064 RepID=UPI00201102EB|nr:FixH family protein [Pseudemcibacter aquimaris]MCC3862272.1 FixH family protein [Pseudemcibacter aquimaris]WDU59022.1 FixH family protein [Pseudemcibacter aquimaris]
MSTQAKPYTGKRILAWFVGFFLVVFTANGIMTYFALNTWTGLETEDSYVKGLNYNDELENARTQNASGWTMDIVTKPESQTGRFEVKIDYPESAIAPSEVKATFIRAVVEGHDQEVTLAPMGNGLYGAPVDLPLPGQWNVLVVVNSQNTLIYKMKDWILVK